MNDEDEPVTINLDDVKPSKIDPIDTPPEEFYNQDDSIYIRLQYFKDTDFFKFEVKNELLQHYDPNDVPSKIMSLCAYIRGMVEVAMTNPYSISMIGVKAMNMDEIDEDETLTEEQKSLFKYKTMGNA